MASSRRKFKKARRNGTLPGKGQGRPPGVPYTVPPKKNGGGGRARSNPPLLTDLLAFVGPGFGGFAATRVASRLTTTMVSRKWPRFGKHAGVLATVASFGAAWLLAHRVKALAEYHTPIVVGSGIAVAQTLFQTYIPKYGWLVGHQTEEPTVPLLDDGGDQEVDYVDDVAGYANPPQVSERASAAPRQTQQIPVEDEDDAILNDLDEGTESYGGVFAN